MGAIWKLMGEATKYDRAYSNGSGSFADTTANSARLALPDLVRLVEWANKEAEHTAFCKRAHIGWRAGVYTPGCSCGLSDIKKLLEE